MPRTEIDLRPVTHITTDALGQPGKRVFYLQGWQEERTLTLIVEKIHIQTLAVGFEQFLSEIQDRFPAIAEASADYVEEKMRITPPVDPLFRVGELGLGYDIEQDMVILIAREIALEEADPEESSVVRFWCTRSQIRSMCHWGMEVAARGRAI